MPPLNAFVAAGTVVKARDRRPRRAIQMLPTPLRLQDAKKQREDFDAILGLGRAELLAYSVDVGSLGPEVEAGLARFLEESDRKRPRRP